MFRQDEQDLQDWTSYLDPVNLVHPVHYQANTDTGFYHFFNIFPSGHGEYPPPVQMIEGGGGSVQADRCGRRRAWSGVQVGWL